MTNHTALAIMAKQPVVGRTKTRLVPFLTPGEAARLRRDVHEVALVIESGA